MIRREIKRKKIDNFINFIGNDWLNGTLLHNYNIYSIKIGTISKKKNYDGLLPDMADLAAIANLNNPNTATPAQNAQNTNFQRTNTQNTHNNTKTQSNTNAQNNINSQSNTNTQSNAMTQNKAPQTNNSQAVPVKNDDINDYPPVYVDPWIEGMFSNDWEKADESVSMDVEILDDKTHHHK